MTEYFHRVEKYKEELPEQFHPHYEYLLSENAAPSVAAAATHYVASVVADSEKIPQRDVAENYDVTQATVSNWANRLIDKIHTWDGDLYPPIMDDFDEWSCIDVPERGPGTNIEHTSQELAGMVADEYDCDLNRRSTSISKKQVLEITKSDSVLEAMKTLEKWGISKNGDYSISITMNKSGLMKLHERASFDD